MNLATYVHRPRSSPPRSVLAQPNGTLWISDGRGGVTRVDLNGDQQSSGRTRGEPNGLAMAEDGTIYVANIGTGTIQKMHPDGRAEELSYRSRWCQTYKSPGFSSAWSPRDRHLMAGSTCEPAGGPMMPPCPDDPVKWKRGAVGTSSRTPAASRESISMCRDVARYLALCPVRTKVESFGAVYGLARTAIWVSTRTQLHSRTWVMTMGSRTGAVAPGEIVASSTACPRI